MNQNHEKISQMSCERRVNGLKMLREKLCRENLHSVNCHVILSYYQVKPQSFIRETFRTFRKIWKCHIWWKNKFRICSQIRSRPSRSSTLGKKITHHLSFPSLKSTTRTNPWTNNNEMRRNDSIWANENQSTDGIL